MKAAGMALKHLKEVAAEAVLKHDTVLDLGS